MEKVFFYITWQFCALKSVILTTTKKYYDAFFYLTRTKTSIRYTKENDREKSEREVKGIERE